MDNEQVISFGKDFFDAYYGKLTMNDELKDALCKSFSLAYSMGLTNGIEIVHKELDEVININSKKNV